MSVLLVVSSYNTLPPGASTGLVLQLMAELLSQCHKFKLDNLLHASSDVKFTLKVSMPRLIGWIQHHPTNVFSQPTGLVQYQRIRQVKNPSAYYAFTVPAS